MWRIAGYGGDEEYGIGLYFQFIEIRVRNPQLHFIYFFVLGNHQQLQGDKFRERGGG